MKIKLLGAAGTVTGSCYLIENDTGEQILVDCGLNQGPPEIEKLNDIPLDIDATKLSGVVLSHAHLDHCGRLPVLEKMGFGGSIYMTPPTADITEISLFDCAKIAAEDHPNDALYDEEMVKRCVKRFRTINYNQELTLGNFKITLRDAGHIIGSASIEVEADGQKLVISADLGNSPEPLIEPTAIIDSADVVIMESTYGDRLHPTDKPVEIIGNEIRTIEKNNGVLLIPAFSIERTQEILHIISHLKQKGEIKEQTSVYLDSPMAIKVTNVYERYRSYLNDEVENDFRTNDPFNFPGLTIIRKPEDSTKIYENEGTKIIIAGSGMMTGGRIVEHARRLLPNPNTRLLIVGFQGEGTLGRLILEGEKDITIKKQSIHINAEITETQAMSSHADQIQLLKWLKNIKGVKQVILAHGENKQREILAEKINNELGIDHIAIPSLNETVVLV